MGERALPTRCLRLMTERNGEEEEEERKRKRGGCEEGVKKLHKPEVHVYLTVENIFCRHLLL